MLGRIFLRRYKIVPVLGEALHLLLILSLVGHYEIPQGPDRLLLGLPIQICCTLRLARPWIP